METIKETRLYKALADETRLRILMALRLSELCVCQIIELFELAPSTISKHLAVLKDAALITSRKKGRWIYYQLNQEGKDKSIAGTLTHLDNLMTANSQIKRDARKLQKILKLDPETLCQIKRKN